MSPKDLSGPPNDMVTRPADMRMPPADMRMPPADMTMPAGDMAAPIDGMTPPTDDMGPGTDDLGPPTDAMGPPTDDMMTPTDDMMMPGADMAMTPTDPSEFIVVRVGDGVAALTGSAAAAFLERYKISDGTLVGTPIALPTAVSGTNRRLTLGGNVASDGALAGLTRWVGLTAVLPAVSFPATTCAV
jgi:hypothetical protein